MLFMLRFRCMHCDEYVLDKLCCKQSWVEIDQQLALLFTHGGLMDH